MPCKQDVKDTRHHVPAGRVRILNFLLIEQKKKKEKGKEWNAWGKIIKCEACTTKTKEIKIVQRNQN